jgi:hypothetical protein
VRATAIAVLTAAALLAPAAGASAAKDCKKTAKLASGKLSRLYDDRHFEKGATLRRDIPFGADTKAKIRFQGVTYKLRRRSEFALGCFGHTVKQGAIYPRVSLRKGQARLIARTGSPGAISTNEAMADPFADRGMRIAVSRRPKNAAGPFGKTWVNRLSGGGYVNLTPYVGKRRGTCRQVDGGTFTSKRLVGGYFKGSARYRGYSSGSPR